MQWLRHFPTPSVYEFAKLDAWLLLYQEDHKWCIFSSSQSKFAILLDEIILFVPDRNIKVDCISVSTSPVKSTIDDLIQQLFDALLTSLRRSITNEVQIIDTFLTSATEALSSRPQTVEEIGEANAKHAELATEKLKACLWTCKVLLFSLKSERSCTLKMARVRNTHNSLKTLFEASRLFNPSHSSL